MTKLHKTATALFLSTALLLSGCSERGNSPAKEPENTSSDGSSDISSSTTTDSECSTPKSESTSEPPSSTSENSTDNPDSTSDYNSSSEGSSDVNAEPVPVEFTEEDKELQKLLGELEFCCEAVELWFSNSVPNGTPQDNGFIFRFSDNNKLSDGFYYAIPEKYSEGNLVIPNTYEDVRETIFKYFSEDQAEKFMCRLAKGSFTKNADGSFSVLLDDDVEKGHIELIEIDKTMYRSSCLITKGFINSIDWRTAKVVSRTDDIIEFSYITSDWYNLDEDDNPIYLNDVSQYEENAYTGVLKYERGGWRRDWDKM